MDLASNKMRLSKRKIRRRHGHGWHDEALSRKNMKIPSLAIVLWSLALVLTIGEKSNTVLVEARASDLFSPIKVGLHSALSRYPHKNPNKHSSKHDHVSTEQHHVSLPFLRRTINVKERMRIQTQTPTQRHSIKPPTTISGGAAAGAIPTRPLLFWETMICGAISRSVAQTVMHPANTMKTMLQNSKGPMVPAILELCKPSSFHRLTYGAGTNFLLSFPTGALNFSVLELVRKRLGAFVAERPNLEQRVQSFGFVLDFVSSSVSTITCSVVATPQMMITDNIMVGNYQNLPQAVKGLYQSGGIKAFYRGWLPGLSSKIPSYALTWTLFQQLKELRNRLTLGRTATNMENSVMGALASTLNVCIMIPLDTIKTRLVVQGGAESISKVPYKGIIDCAVRVFREEGIGAFYRGLPPRLVSVVPMIGIQFTVYEAMKRVMLSRDATPTPQGSAQSDPQAAQRKRKGKRLGEPPPPITLLEEVEQVSGELQALPKLKTAALPKP